MDPDNSQTSLLEPSGLSTQEAAARFARFGPNAVPEERPHPLRALVARFWAPVPWMLDVAVALELVLHRNVEAGVIGGLLVFNAALSFLQEDRAQRALELLRSRLSIEARVRRDATWQRVPADQLVPDDVIHVRVGDMVPADARVSAGSVQIDESALTGESTPVEAAAGDNMRTGGLVTRGEATAFVTATGSRTFFGKTAELVRQARATGRLQQTIFTIVKYLVVFDVALAAFVLAYARVAGLGFADVLPFCLMLLVASIPVALPATFTLASAIGTQELARQGVLVSRLSAIEEAAAMEALATDKTGTLTKNTLSVARVVGLAPYSEADVLRFAALASDDSTQDPIDLAVLAAARERGVTTAGYTVASFVPFDPATKRSEALVQHGPGSVRIAKGAPSAIAGLTGGSEPAQAGELAGRGYRVLAVAAGPERSLAVAGFLALLDPPRDDSASLVQSLHQLGVRLIMITGDGLATARAVAAQVGITGLACDAEHLRDDPAAVAAECGVIGGVLPEDKFHLVQALQRAGHVVGMTGDGVNDAPALKQAEVGVAVANATDVAKAAASIVLIKPGLAGIVSAVEISRRIYQRMLTYTLNKIIKTIEIALFLSLGVILTRSLVITPVLIVLLLFTNDFVTMSIATDTVSYSATPDRWRIGTLVMTAAALAALIVTFSLSVLFVGRDLLGLSPQQIPALAFLTLVFSGQATVYLVRERSHFWRSRPSRWMLLSSGVDLIVVSGLALRGVLMSPLPAAIVCGLLAAVAVYFGLLDFVKIAIFRRFGVR